MIIRQLSKYRWCWEMVFIFYFIACNDHTPTQEAIIIDSTSSPQQNADWALMPFTKVDSLNPVLTPGSGEFVCPILHKKIKWEEKDVFNPAVVVRNDSVFMLYRAEDKIGKYAGTSRIGLAVSTDGLHFTRYPEPVLYPDNDEQKKYEWEGGCEDPRIVQDREGTYYMTYTAYDGKIARLLVATSKDLVHWTKHGPAFAKAFKGKYINTWSKSGSIVSAYENDGKIVAMKIFGRYWMYWGDVNIWIASSTDLINWQPALQPDSVKVDTALLRHYAKEVPELISLLTPRAKKFDSDIVEPGPPAMFTGSGIVLLYNGRNIPSIGDSSLPEGAYCGGQAYMPLANPLTATKRLDNWFIKPDKPYETSGQVNQVCFIEGLIYFKKKWFLYYGTADSKIAVAVK